MILGLCWAIAIARYGKGLVTYTWMLALNPLNPLSP